MSEVKIYDEMIEKAFYFIDRDNLKSKSRKRELVYKRHFLMYFLRSKGLTFSQVGEAFNTDHSRAIYGVKCHKNMMQINDKVYKGQVNEYSKELQNFEYKIKMRDLFIDVEKCKNLESLKRIKRWMDEGRYEDFRKDL